MSILKYINFNFINKVSYANFYYTIIVSITSRAYANNLNSHIAYCDHIQVGQQEDLVIQKLVKLFAAEMNCIISSYLQQWMCKMSKIFNCLTRTMWTCIYCQYQLGDNGRGSTFVFECSKNSVCCWPL
ncbi:hypothetical protein A1C_03005 [Rickettsia akari str. Hartford]|uniref:Uncharacterized protein n=1 Tax=Rickettsia akari (strain Hartford) TaxID=293614 RepID=A8GNB6_RICAH|nr:hypothetical protein A1C_03005 [Rickettsia akari str. Hartford]